jgi:predicted unusual protein kinase regulating ubiquinone biosynthesis (AarF/ABC1/UbiB family)
MTYLDGFDWAAAQEADQDLKNTWAEVIQRFSYGNFRYANLVQADPHPGNYRFNSDGSVGFVDFGCVKVLPERDRHPWVAMTRAAIEERIEDARDLMAEVGFFAIESPLTIEELRVWWAELLPELISTTQPATYTPENFARLVEALFAVKADQPVARMTVPEHFALFPRAQFAISNICSTFRATLYARAIADDMDGVAEPTTELGKLHSAWLRERGLPSALDHHDHP